MCAIAGTSTASPQTLSTLCRAAQYGAVGPANTLTCIALLVQVVFYRFKAQDLKAHHSRGDQSPAGDSDVEVATSEPDENDDVDAHEAAANARDALKVQPHPVLALST